MRFRRAGLPSLALFLLAANLALAKENEQATVTDKAAIPSQDSKTGFGRPETVTGTIVMVRPKEGIVILAVRGQSAPSSTQIVVHQKTFRDGEAVVQEEDTTATKGPGETDFSFRVVRSTLIKVDGQPVALPELTASTGREATVRFVPQRAGDFALGIEVG